MDPDLGKLNHQSGGELICNREEDAVPSRKPKMPEQEKHAEPGQKEVSDKRPVICQGKWKQAVAEQTAWICPIDVGIRNQRTPGKIIGVPPGDYSLAIGAVNGPLNWQIVGKLVNDVVVR